MDVLYYWKDFQSDLKNRRVGWLASQQQKLGEIRGRLPNYIWAIKTPLGCKGEVRLIARLTWSDKPIALAAPKDRTSIIHYDQNAMVLFDAAGNDDVHGEINRILRTNFPIAYRANFQGVNGVQALEANVLVQVRRLASSLSGHPFIPAVPPLPSTVPGAVRDVTDRHKRAGDDRHN